MKTSAILILAALSLAACSVSDPKQPNAQLQAWQDQCTAGDMNACADLAHAVKNQ